MDNCETCLYWKLDESQDSDEIPDEHVGECRRYPPVLVLMDTQSEDYDTFITEGLEDKTRDACDPLRASHSFVYWSQPFTMDTCCCGEHKPKPCDPDVVTFGKTSVG